MMIDIIIFQYKFMLQKVLTKYLAVAMENTIEFDFWSLLKKTVWCAIEPGVSTNTSAAGVMYTPSQTCRHCCLCDNYII